MKMCAASVAQGEGHELVADHVLAKLLDRPSPLDNRSAASSPAALRRGRTRESVRLRPLLEGEELCRRRLRRRLCEDAWLPDGRDAPCVCQV